METWNRLTVNRGRGEGDNGGKKGKELVKEHERPLDMDNSVGINCGSGGGMGRGWQRGTNRDNCNRKTILKIFKKRIMSTS